MDNAYLFDQLNAQGKNLPVNHCQTADLNGDGLVDMDDFNLFNSMFGLPINSPEMLTILVDNMENIIKGQFFIADFNNDGTIDFADFGIFGLCYNDPTPSNCIQL